MDSSEHKVNKDRSQQRPQQTKKVMMKVPETFYELTDEQKMEWGREFASRLRQAYGYE